MNTTNFEISTLQQKLAEKDSVFRLGTRGRGSAVLLPLIYQENQWQVLFEVRSSRLKTQPGEICFPGGGVDKGEEPADAALREICEELLIQPEQVEILGTIDGSVSPRGTLIWAYVGVLKDYQNTFSEDEVGEVFCVPLSDLLAIEPVIGHVRQQTVLMEDFPVHLLPNKKDYKWGEPVREIVFYPWKDRVIWGVTARILQGFLEEISENDKHSKNTQ